MTTNTTPPASNWDEFRGRLFESIERRRPIAATFKYADVYYFVTRCRSASNSPGTDKAQEALDAIAQNGSFRLVAESLDDFLAMLPSIQPLAGQVAQLNRSRHCQEADDKAAVQPEAHKDDYNRSGSGWVTRDECGTTRSVTDTPTRRPSIALPSRAKRLHPPPDLGRAVPFDPEKFKGLMNETCEIRDWLAARRPTGEPSSSAMVTTSNPCQPKSGSPKPANVLDEKHKTLLRDVLHRPSWAIADFRVIAKKVGLLPWACMATLNAWALNNYGDLLLEGDSIITINQNLKENILL